MFCHNPGRWEGIPASSVVGPRALRSVQSTYRRAQYLDAPRIIDT